jgi:hypothetical protein
MLTTARYWLAILDVVGLPILVQAYIWRLQFTTPGIWIIIPIWIIASFLLHRDNPKTLGWRADNLWPATVQAAIAFSIATVGLIALGLTLGASHNLPPHLFDAKRLWNYFAFCLLQQVAAQSFLNNRLIFLIRRRWPSSFLVGAIFGILHWPNPVLVPATFIGGTAMAWLFARHRNVIPLAIGQALLSSLLWWSVPIAWHHHFRVGPGYYRPL